MNQPASPIDHTEVATGEMRSGLAHHGAMGSFQRILASFAKGSLCDRCRKSPHYCLAAFLFTVIFVAPLLFIPSGPMADHSLSLFFERTGDFATIALDVGDAKHGLLLTGPYSRFTFNHPSPLLGYWYAPVEWSGLFGTGFNAYAMAQALWNQLWLLIAGIATFCTSGSLALVVAMNTLAFCHSAFVRP